MWELDHKEGWVLKNWCFQTMVLEKTLESPLYFREIKMINPKGKQSWILIGKTEHGAEVPIHWPRIKEPTHWKRPWCWERLKAKEGGHRGWDGWMASPTQRTWVWPSSGSWWRTGKPGGLQSIGSQRVGHDWATELKSLWAWGPTICVLIGRLADSDHTKIWEPHIPAWQVLQSSASLWDAGEKTKSTAQNRTRQE